MSVTEGIINHMQKDEINYEKSICCLRVSDISDFSEMFDVMFFDLEKVGYSKVIEKHTHHGIIHNFALSSKIQKVFPILTNIYCLEYYNLPKAIKEESDKNNCIIVILTNNSLIESRYPKSLIVYLRKKYPNVVWVLFYLDQIRKRKHCAYADLLREAGCFDYIYTYNYIDAQNYNLLYHSTPYSKIFNQEKSESEGLYYCGTNPSFLPVLNSIARRCIDNSIPFTFDVVSDPVKYSDLLFKLHDIKNGYLSYTSLLKKAMNTNCILELVNPENGPTLRTFEAVCYGKKLLTNNKSIVSFPYYNEKYMKVFEKIEDIDLGWITRKETVNYSYKGDFSPLTLYEDIVSRLSEKK